MIVTKEEIFKLDNYRCRVWGCSNLDVEEHHIIKKSLGGTEDNWNKISLCRFHHSQIHTRGINILEYLEPLKNRPFFRWQKAYDWWQERKLTPYKKHIKEL